MNKVMQDEVTGLGLLDLQLHSKQTAYTHKHTHAVTQTRTATTVTKLPLKGKPVLTETSLPLFTPRLCFVLLKRFISREQSQKVPREVLMPRALPFQTGHF